MIRQRKTRAFPTTAPAGATLVTRPQVQTMLQIGTRAYYGLRDAGLLPVVMVGSAVRHRLADVKAVEQNGAPDAITRRPTAA